VNENYNNSKEGNGMRIQIDKAFAAGKTFVVLTKDKVDLMLAVSVVATEVLDENNQRIQTQGRVTLATHLFTHLVSKEDALKKIEDNS
jgi:hypothetical protein